MPADPELTAKRTRAVGERCCVCELVALLDIPRPTRSHHLSEARTAPSAAACGPTTTSAPDALKELLAWLS